jgi:hypothetical protein
MLTVTVVNPDQVQRRWRSLIFLLERLCYQRLDPCYHGKGNLTVRADKRLIYHQRPQGLPVQYLELQYL